MDKQPVFSIIVPLYNCEDLAEALVNSFNSQTKQCFEVIFVNDGSKDGTLLKLNNSLMTAVFPHKVLTQENSGPGAARNNGIGSAVGKYLLFADSDDFLEANALEVLSQNAEETDADVLLFGYYQDFYKRSDVVDHSVTVIPEKMFLSGNKTIISRVPMLDRQKVFSFAWNKAVKRSTVSENNVVFSDRMHSEDYFFYIDVFQYIGSISVLDKPLYHYVKSPRETLTNQPYLKNYYDLITERYEAMQRLLKNADCYSGDTAAIAAGVHIKHIFSHFSNNCSKYSGMSGKSIRNDIRQTFSDSATEEAIALAGDNSRAERIMNSILRSENVWLCYFFAKAVSLLRNSRLFDKMK